MRIVLASDHAGVRLKQLLVSHLVTAGHSAVDLGTHTSDIVDYPLVIRPAALAVATGKFERGIVLGGSGQGEAIVANRVRGIRCALCWDVTTARLGREHNDANMLSLGARLLSDELAIEIVDVWLTTPFEGGRHTRRIAEIDESVAVTR